MKTYNCEIKTCVHNNTSTTERKSIFGHYLKHLRQELNTVAIDLNISKPYFENRYSLINSIIDNSRDTFKSK
jgi:hypothetical protein